MGSQRVGHNCVTNTHSTATAIGAHLFQPVAANSWVHPDSVFQGLVPMKNFHNTDYFSPEDYYIFKKRLMVPSIPPGGSCSLVTQTWGSSDDFDRITPSNLRRLVSRHFGRNWGPGEDEAKLTYVQTSPLSGSQRDHLTLSESSPPASSPLPSLQG